MSHQHNNSKFQLGDIVKIVDGSWNVVLYTDSNQQITHNIGLSLAPLNKWRVIVSHLPANSKLPIHLIPTCQEMDKETLESSGIYNDTFLQNVHDETKYVFTNSKFIITHPDENDPGGYYAQTLKLKEEINLLKEKIRELNNYVR